MFYPLYEIKNLLEVEVLRRKRRHEDSTTCWHLCWPGSVRQGGTGGHCIN